MDGGDRLAARLTFHGELTPLLGPARLALAQAYPLERRASIKDVIEALGVPHTEVYGLTVDGADVGFGHILEPGQEAQVFPAAPPVDPTAPSPLRPPLPAPLAFVADVNVGRLANLLLILGLDTVFDHRLRDADIAALAQAQGRLVLTRDRNLLKRGIIQHGRLVRADRPEAQLREVLTLYGLRGPFAPFSRCLRCNLPLSAVSKAQVLERLQPRTRLYYDNFSQCPGCGRVYWAGSHHERLAERLRRMGLAD